MGVRRIAREQALQVLYADEVNGLGVEENLEACIRFFKMSPEASRFTRELVNGVNENRVELDKYLDSLISNWKFDRTTLVDRVILRLAAYEMIYLDDIPITVSINEAIDIAKRFSTEQSGRFINGILDRLKDELNCEDD